MAPSNEAPLTAEEVRNFLHAQLQRSPNQDRKSALRAVGGELAKADYSRLSPAQLGQLLVDNMWKLEGRPGITSAQLRHLGDVLDQVLELQDRPDDARRFMAESARRQADSRGAVPQAPAPSGQSQASRSRPPVQRLADEVSRSGAGSVIVHTDHVKGTQVRYGSREAGARHGGFGNFGDGVDDASSRGSEDVRRAMAAVGRDLYEGVAFVPAHEQLYRPEQYVEKKRLFGPDQLATRQVADGTQPRMVDGPNGPEPGVRFAYAFDPNQLGGRSEERPMYQETGGSRPGNMLKVEALLPESVAQRLQQAIEQDPTAARAVAERLVLQNGGLDRAAWEGSGQASGRMKPPWEQTSSSEPIHLVTPGPDGKPVVRRLEQAGNQQPRQDHQKLREDVARFTGKGSGQEPASRHDRGGSGSRSYESGHGWSAGGPQTSQHSGRRV